MIEYKIIVNHKRDTPPPREVVKPGDNNYHQVVFYRNLKANRYENGHRVKIRGTSKKGVIVHVEKDLDKVMWTKNKPMFLTVQFDDKEVKLCNPTQLKRTK